MSQVAELTILQRQVRELEDNPKTIERGLSKKEMKLRDEFAMAALSGMMANSWNQNYIGWAEHAYMLADAMLAAREK